MRGPGLSEPATTEPEAQVVGDPIAMNGPSVSSESGTPSAVTLRGVDVTFGNHRVLKDVTISRDLGKTVEIGSGLTADDRVIESPPDGIGSGDLVRIAGSPEAAQAELRRTPD